MIKRGDHPKRFLTALVADRQGKIFELDGFAAVGGDGMIQVPLTLDNTIKMPSGGELMFLPDRIPILYRVDTGRFEIVSENPYIPGEPLFPVSAFNSPGYLVTHTCAYEEQESAGYLPLFSYGAVGWHQDHFYSALMQVDAEKRQDLRFMKEKDVVSGVRYFQKEMPENRLRAHLEKCALTYGCPAGKNFFLGRYEAPLPTSGQCNARCLGCLSRQENDSIPHSQDRISFTPRPQEIAEVALAHIKRVENSVVSFGQGCEGDPLLAAEVIAPAVRMIRAHTAEGTIHMNTNGSLPDRLSTIFDAGLDSIRISLNSIRPECYAAYFRPRGYDFADVVGSIETALKQKKFVAINYLSCPGFTDTPDEIDAIQSFLNRYPIHMVQWRNLNFDPVRYLRVMNDVKTHSRPVGMNAALMRIKAAFPALRYGYFNPPKEKWLL